MNNTQNIEQATVHDSIEAQRFTELSDLQLALVGGGDAVVAFG